VTATLPIAIAAKNQLQQVLLNYKFVANRRPCYNRAHLNGKTDSDQWKKNTWLEWVSSGKTVAKII